MVYDFFDELYSIIKEFIRSLYSKIQYYIVFIALIILCFLVFKLNRIDVNPNNLDTQTIYVFGISIENLAEWVSLITIPYTAGWAIFQYRKSVMTKKRDKAGEIAKEFSNSIVDDLGIVNAVIQKSIISNYVPKEELINQKKLKYFTVDEARFLFNKDSIIDEYKEIMDKSKEQIDKIFHLILYDRNVPYSKRLLKKYTDSIKNGTRNNINWKKIDSFLEKKYPDIPYHFREYETKMLNKLEAICLDISTKAADSKFIYQSLHQIFLRNIRNLYLEISSINIDSKNKYYTNIISVYNEWVNIYIEGYRKEKRLFRYKSEKDYEATKP